MWSEQVEGEAIQGKLWPRGAALAERLWSDLPTGGYFMIIITLIVLFEINEESKIQI